MYLQSCKKCWFLKMLVKSRLACTAKKKGHLNPWKMPVAQRWPKLPACPETRWPYWMTARDGQWQPPLGNNENLTTFGSPSAKCTESINGPFKTHQSHKAYCAWSFYDRSIQHLTTVDKNLENKLQCMTLTHLRLWNKVKGIKPGIN